MINDDIIIKNRADNVNRFFFTNVGKSTFERCHPECITNSFDAQTRNNVIINGLALFKVQPIDMVDTIAITKHFENTNPYSSDGILRLIKESLPIIIGYLTCIIII